MIMTVTELKQYVTTDISNKVLEARLQALELLVRGYTNNNFQKRAFRTVAVAVAVGISCLFPSSSLQGWGHPGNYGIGIEFWSGYCFGGL